VSEEHTAGNGWKQIFKGSREEHDGIEELPAPPPWRSFDGVVPPGAADSVASISTDGSHRNPGRGQGYLATPEQIQMVNAALYLRRPLLVTGKPGTGKSSLAYAVAYELKLGPVLRWPITSRSTLAEGLYRYDAIGRLQEVQLAPDKLPEIERYLQLGPLGTALLPASRPRALLIDEIDKSDIDLPNDLLNIFEEGEYEIPELTRYPKEHVNVRMFESDITFPITRGQVKCHAFPFVVLTSNGEREFPPPFLRRCLRLDILPPDKDELAKIVELHFRSEMQTSVGQSSKLLTEAELLITDFLQRRNKGDLATDQLLNAVYLITRDHAPQGQTRAHLIDALLKHLGSADIA
jgi:MoxR-like ATPase